VSQSTHKPSEIPWLDDIPSKWEVKPLFALTRENKEKNAGGAVTNVLSLSYGKIIQRDINSNTGLLPESFDTYQIIQPGDIVLRLLDLQNDHKSLRVGFVKEMGIISPVYVCIRKCSSVNMNFLAYLLHTYDIMKVFYSFGGGIRQAMKFDDLRRLPILLPPENEQEAIVAFIDSQIEAIDRVTGLRRIDRVLGLIDTQITLMQEYRSAIIYECVTGKRLVQTQLQQ